MNRLYFGNTQDRGAVLSAAPTFNNSNFDFTSTGPSSHSFAPGVTWSAGQRLETISGVGASPTITALAGDTDDVTAGSAVVNNVPRVYRHWWTINSSLDSNFNWTLSGSSRLVAGFLVFDGVTGSTATAGANSGTALLAPSFTVTGGPRNFLALSVVNIEGRFKDNPAIPEGTWTSIGNALTSTGDDPSAASHSSIAIAYRTYNAGDLTWSNGEATVPAMQWSTVDYVAQDWNAMSWGLLS